MKYLRYGRRLETTRHPGQDPALQITRLRCSIPSLRRKLLPARRCRGVNGYADALQPFYYPDGDEYDSTRKLMGEDFDPHIFDLRGAHRRMDDFLQTIGEAR